MLFDFLFCFLFLLIPIHGARILGIVPVPSFSHQIVFRPLWRELSLRGHQVTVLTTDPMNDPALKNLTEIDMSVSYKRWRALNLNEVAKMNPFEMVTSFTNLMAETTEEQLLLPEVQEILKNNKEHFDLVMLEDVLPAMSAFSEKFNCPLIRMLSLDAVADMYYDFGNPSHPVLNPDFVLGLPDDLNFWQRLTSALYTIFSKFLLYYYIVPVHNAIVKKHFGNDYPELKDIRIRKTSMMFINTDTVFHRVRPLLPNIIQFGGGTHLTPPKPLPKDLKNKLDNATNGFIYFSLGSNIKSEKLSEDTRKILLETFAELPYTVLWKFEKDLPNKPDNVIISKWFPQQDIFRHPNIKLFITQGGLQSSEEAIYSHVPMVGIPFIGDQSVNVQRMVDKDIALVVNYETMDKATLKTAISEVIDNPSYRKKIKELAELARDQPMTGLERAIWWTEYAIRHKGAAHLRSPALDLPDYQYYLLDVIGFCLIVLVIVLYTLVKLVAFIFRLIKRLVWRTKTKQE